jgi:hypothetical protein
MIFGELKKFVEDNKDLPDDFPLVGFAHQYDYPTEVTMVMGKYNKEESEFNGTTPCILVSCKA